jgi:hypothetical protein
MRSRIIAAACFATFAFLSTPAIPTLENVGTEDVSLRFRNGDTVQVEYLADYFADEVYGRDCIWYEDGSADC